MTGASRVRALSIHADYGCRHAGACCSSGWEIPVEPETEDRLRAALRSGSLRLDVPHDTPGGECFRRVTGLPHGARVLLRTDPTGRCVFFNPSRGPCGLCAVHGGLGEDALPSSCRHFPRVVTLSPLGVSVTLSHYCPTAAGMLFVIPRSPVTPGDEESASPPNTHDPALRIVDDPPAFPAAWPYEGLDARDALPPLLRPGVLMDWPSLERWERFAVSVLADERAPEAALDVLEAVAEDARRWTPEDGPFDAFFERVLSRRGAPSASGDEGSAATADSSGPVPPASLGMTAAWWLVAGTVPRRELGPPGFEDAVGADARWVAPAWPALARPIRRWLAAKAFASWIALQGDGLRTTVLGLRVALGVLRVEAARGCAGAGRALDGALLQDAVRRADLLLVHLADPEALARRLSRCELAVSPMTERGRDGSWRVI